MRFLRWRGNGRSGQPRAASTATMETTRPVTVVGNDLAAGATDPGLVREHNEDTFRILEARDVYVVCDGLGGLEAGEVASEVGATALDRFFTQEKIETAFQLGSEAMKRLMRDALDFADQQVRKRQRTGDRTEEMATTAVCAVIHKGTLLVGNLGDSRCYLLRKGSIRQITQDHTYAAALVILDQLSAEEARSHPSRNQLTACLGRRNRNPAHVAIEQLERDDRIILCSDGLWDMLSDDRIAQIAANDCIAEAIKTMIREANAAGGKDNITAVLVRVAGPDLIRDHDIDDSTMGTSSWDRPANSGPDPEAS